MPQAIPYAQLKASPTLVEVEVSYGTDDPKIEHDTKEGYIPRSCKAPFDPAWFNLPATRYNPLLATSSMALTSATYGNHVANDYTYITTTMASYGFTDVDISSYYHRNKDDHSDLDRDVDLVAYAFGHRTIKDENGEPCELVALVVRGTSPTKEWLSNANVADSVTDGDYASLRWHEGFRKSEQECFEHFLAYVREHDLDDGRTRIWNLGHSRGGPVANILAMDLNNLADQGLSITPDHIYTYTIACSLTTFDADAHDPAKYGNVFNVNHPEDFIGRIPLSRWGFKRYGTDVFLPSIATAYGPFQKVKPLADAHFLVLGGVTRSYTVHGIAGPDSFIHEACSCAADVAQMYQLPHASGHHWHPFTDFFNAFCLVAGTHGMEQVKDAAKLGKLAAGAYWHALSYFVEDQFLKPFSPITHNEQHYLARFMAVDELELPVLDLWKADTRRITFYGTLDVEVVCLDEPTPTDTFNDGKVSVEGASLQPKDEGGRVVGRIVKNKVDDKLYDTPDCVALYADHRTNRLCVWLPVEGHYLVRLIAREDNDAIDATCALCHPEGAVLAQTAFSAGSLKAGHSLVFDGADLVAKLPREAVDAAWEHHAKTGDFPVPLSVEASPYPARTEGGDAVGDRPLMAGDHALLRAYEVDGHRFKGWHEDAGDGTPGRLVSRDRVLSVPVAADADGSKDPVAARYVAVFE